MPPPQNTVHKNKYHLAKYHPVVYKTDSLASSSFLLISRGEPSLFFLSTFLAPCPWSRGHHSSPSHYPLGPELPQQPPHWSAGLLPAPPSSGSPGPTHRPNHAPARTPGHTVSFFCIPVAEAQSRCLLQSSPRGPPSGTLLFDLSPPSESLGAVLDQLYSPDQVPLPRTDLPHPFVITFRWSLPSLV